MINKKGEMTKEQLIATIFIVIAVAFLIIFIVRASLGSEIDRDTCHESIILRSSFNLGPLELSKKAVPLKCATEKICLTMSGEDCGAYAGYDKTNPPVKVKLSSDKTEAMKQIEESLANALYDCHAILGEGKLDFANHDFYSNNYCLICARIALDEKARQVFSDGLRYDEFYQYLARKAIPNDAQKRSYLQYLYPGLEVKDLPTFVEDIKKSDPVFKDMTLENWKIDLSQEDGYGVIAQMIPLGTFVKWVGIGAGAVVAAGGAVLVATGIFAEAGIPLMVVGGKILIGTGVVASGVMYVKGHPNNKYKYISPMLFPYNADSLRNFGCYSFETAP